MEYNCSLIKVDWLAKYTFCVVNHWSTKKSKNWPHPLFRPRTDHVCPQKPNTSRKTVPLKYKEGEQQGAEHDKNDKRTVSENREVS